MAKKQYLDFKGLQTYNSYLKKYLAKQQAEQEAALAQLKTYSDDQDMAVYNAISSIEEGSINELFPKEP